jgi:hypothetical protein
MVVEGSFEGTNIVGGSISISSSFLAEVSGS